MESEVIETKVSDLKQEPDGSSIGSSKKRRGSFLKPRGASLVSRDELTEVGSHISGWDTGITAPHKVLNHLDHTIYEPHVTSPTPKFCWSGSPTYLFGELDYGF